MARRTLRVSVATLVTSLALVGCGSEEPPTTDDGRAPGTAALAPSSNESVAENGEIPDPPGPTSTATEYVHTGDPLVDATNAPAAKAHLADDIEEAAVVAAGFVDALHTRSDVDDIEAWMGRVDEFTSPAFGAALRSEYATALDGSNREYPGGWALLGDVDDTPVVSEWFDITASSLTFTVVYTATLQRPETEGGEALPQSLLVHMAPDPSAPGEWVAVGKEPVGR